MKTKKNLKITVVTNKQRSNEIQRVLMSYNIRDFYRAVCRIPALEESTGFDRYVRNRALYTSRPAEIITFYIADDQAENDCLNLIAAIGNFYQPGSGSVFSEEVDANESHPLCVPSRPEFDRRIDGKLYENLVGIFCVVQRGQGDFISRIILDHGSVAPTITYGLGMGIRDKLGLLRITIPPEKEIISLVSTVWDANELLEEIVEKGRLKQPGRGFISTYPVRKGVINIKTASEKAGSGVSMEHVIAALDRLTGDLEWRRSVTDEEKGIKNRYFSGCDINIICNAGSGEKLVKAAIDAGCGGGTIEKLALEGTMNDTVSCLSRAREKCKLMVPEDKVDAVIDSIRKAGSLDDEAKSFIYHNNVMQALTYLTPLQQKKVRKSG